MCEAGKCESQIENMDIGNSLHAILFHSKSCGHCNKMMPEWKKFKNEHSKHLKITEVEASEQPEIMEKHNISHGEAIEYFDFNIAGLGLGQGTPIIVWKLDEH